MVLNASLNASHSTRKARGSNRTASKDRALPQAERQKEAAQYISDMILELRNMAKSNQLFQVMVPLEYAYYEAFSAANKLEAPPEEVERLRELSKVSESLEAETPGY